MHSGSGNAERRESETIFPRRLLLVLHFGGDPGTFVASPVAGLVPSFSSRTEREPGYVSVTDELETKTIQQWGHSYVRLIVCHEVPRPPMYSEGLFSALKKPCEAGLHPAYCLIISLAEAQKLPGRNSWNGRRGEHYVPVK